MNAKNESRSPCPISNVLDWLGDKWSLLIVRDVLFYGKHEYKEFLASPESIATNILADRLKRLTACGVLGELTHPENRSRKLYYVTESGKALLPILGEMVLWADAYMPPNEIIKQLATSIKANPAAVKAKMLAAASEWEAKYLP
jgi:DNA-binding HxlR family transcriptional regulator